MQTETREVTRRRFTVHEYDKTAEAGMLHEGDRVEMSPIGGRAGIPEAWTMDANGGRLERHTDPTGDLYRHAELARRGESPTSTTLPESALVVDDVLGRG